MERNQSRLLATWERKKAERKAQGKAPLLQKDLALKHGVSAPLIGHYLHGREPLNIKWQIRFAEFLGVPVLDIWPDFEHKQALLSGLPANAIEFALDFLEITDQGQEALRSTMAALPRRESARRASK